MTQIASATSPLVRELDAPALEALLASSPLPVLVDIWAPWCGPCKAMLPTLEQLATGLAGRAVVVKMNVDGAPELATRFQVQAVPTLLLFKDGKVLDRIVGARPLTDLEHLVAEHLARPAASG